MADYGGLNFALASCLGRFQKPLLAFQIAGGARGGIQKN